MYIYIINIFVIIFSSIIFGLYVRKKNQVIFLEHGGTKKNIVNILIVFQLLILSMLRSNTVGKDLQNYLYRFDIVANNNIQNLFFLRDTLDSEYGFLLFNKLISIIWNNHQFLIIVTSLIIILSFSKFISRYSKIPWLSYYLFVTLAFYGNSFNILRQYIAISILLFSIKFIIDKKLFRFLIYVVIASLFHTSSIVFLLLYPLSKIKISRLYVLVYSIGLLFLGLISSQITFFILKHTRYKSYLQKFDTGSGEVMLIVLLTVLFLILFFYKSIRKSGINIEEHNIWTHMIMLSILFNIFALNLGLFERIMRYFMVALIIAIPNTIYATKKEYRAMGIVLVVLLCGFYYFGIIMTDYDSSGGIIPYTFFWE